MEQVLIILFDCTMLCWFVYFVVYRLVERRRCVRAGKVAQENGYVLHVGCQLNTATTTVCSILDGTTVMTPEIWGHPMCRVSSLFSIRLARVQTVIAKFYYAIVSAACLSAFVLGEKHWQLLMVWILFLLQALRNYAIDEYMKKNWGVIRTMAELFKVYKASEILGMCSEGCDKEKLKTVKMDNGDEIICYSFLLR